MAISTRSVADGDEIATPYPPTADDARNDTKVHDALLVRSIDRYIHLLETAYQIQMTTKDFDLFKANEPDFTTPATLAFINRKLAIDLGGIHSAESQTVDLDAQAVTFGLAKGEIYPMRIFFAERHVIGSDFVVETTLSEIGVCD